MTEERKGPTGLLGPKQPDKYMAWRRNRDKMIANPRRLKTCKDEQKEKESSDNSDGAE